MHLSKQFCYSGFVFGSVFRLAVAWTSSGLEADLAWPPIGNEGYFTQNGQVVAPNIDPVAFPCASISPPISTTSQNEFPLSGACLQFDLRNASVHTAQDQFVVDIYLGQFSNDVDPDKTGWTYVNTLTYNDITTGPQCTDQINITNEVVNAPAFNLQLAGSSNSELVGVSLTLGLRIVLFHGDNNFEEMYQCSYLNLVAANAPVTRARGVCNPGPLATTSSSSPSTTATATSSGLTITGTSLPSSTLTSTPTTAVGAGNNSADNGIGHHSRTIGIAVGVSVGAALLLLLLGFFLLRRRRSRQPKDTLALDFWVSGRENGKLEQQRVSKGDLGVESSNISAWKEDEKQKEGMIVTTKAKDDGNDRVSIGGSEHSEPLPVYHREGTANRE